jgi:uncharacterized protein YutE (UPF0331/DUF86 family)
LDIGERNILVDPKFIRPKDSFGDMLSHIISADFNEKWDYYSDIAEILKLNNVITEEDKIILNNMVGFRNRLSHEYLSLDLNVLTDIINNRLDDFNRFLIVVKNYCKI